MTKFSLVSFFCNRNELQNAIRELHQAGFDSRHFSIVGKEHLPNGFFTWKHTAIAGAKEVGHWGTLVGGLLGMLAGTATLLIPGVGPIVIAGPIIGILAGGAEGAVLGEVGGGVLGAGMGALLGHFSIPHDRAPGAEAGIKAGKIALLITGDSQEQERARDVLKNAGIEIDEGNKNIVSTK